MSLQRSLVRFGLMLPLLVSSASACSANSDESAEGSAADVAVFCELAPKIISGAQSADREQLRAALRIANDRGAGLSDNSPAAVRDDVITFVQGLKAMDGVLKGVGYDPSRIEPERAAALMTPEFQTSVVAVQGAVATACGDGDPDASAAPR